MKKYVMIFLLMVLLLTACSKVDGVSSATEVFNHGKQAEICFEIGREGFTKENKEFSEEMTPQILAQRINTIQDSIFYFQQCGFMYDTTDPIYVDEKCEWTWAALGFDALSAKCGSSGEIHNVATYLLKDDFEECGRVYIVGVFGYKIYSWFYVDECYYVVDYSSILWDLAAGDRNEEYIIEKIDSLDGVITYFESISDMNTTIAAVMLSLDENYNTPAIFINFLSDSSRSYEEKTIIGFEEKVFNRSTVLFENKDFDHEIIAIPDDCIPEEVPRD